MHGNTQSWQPASQSVVQPTITPVQPVVQPGIQTVGQSTVAYSNPERLLQLEKDLRMLQSSRPVRQSLSVQTTPVWYEEGRLSQITTIVQVITPSTRCDTAASDQFIEAQLQQQTAAGVNVEYMTNTQCT